MKTDDRIAPGVSKDQRVSFVFDGKSYEGLEGDTLASALLANGVFVVGRSFKLHRPRGILAAGADEPNAIVQLQPGSERSEPDLKATQVQLYDGLVASSVNRWPSVEFDVGAALGVLKRFLPAGFYYKTFMWPNWHMFEPSIRKAAGLGVAPNNADPEKYDTRHAHCDVLVIGAGPAGLTAVDMLSKAGASVILVDENVAVGSSFMWTPSVAGGLHSLDWAMSQAEEIRSRPNVRVLRRTTATGYYDDNALTLVERVSEHLPIASREGHVKQRLWIARVKHVVIATGAHERPIVFGNNDRPGIMLSNAGATYASHYGVRLGKSALGFTNNDRAYQAFFGTHDSGTPVHNIVDSRDTLCIELVTACQSRGITLHLNAVVCNTLGRKRVKDVEIRAADGKRRTLPCDLLLMSGGWSPAVHLYSQAQGRLRYDPDLAMFRPQVDPSEKRCTVIGSANGTMGAQSAIFEAMDASATIVGRLGLKSGTEPAKRELSGLPDAEYRISPLWRVEGSKASAWVDFQNDVTESDVRLASRENFISVEHLKRYTTMGMASDQGKTSNVNALALLGSVTGRTPDQVGTTRFRPPYSPVTIGAFAGHARGDMFMPRRYLAAHDAHLRHNAQILEYGNWMRPAFYRLESETDEQAWNREVLHVRSKAGVFDGSPLGKIEVKGPDVVELLNAVYANELGTLGVGKCRYSVILNEGGGILDDGVISRLSQNHFLVGTSSAGVQRVLEAFEYWRESGRGYRVAIMQASDQWATYAVAGPEARRVMQSLQLDIDIGKDAFPHMSFRQGRLDGMPCRVARVSFSGEVTFEVSVPAHYGCDVFERIVEAGATPFGVEALMIMRTEKGFIHVGVETEPATTLQDVGMGALGSRKALPFIGQRAAKRAAMTHESRLQLVGIECVEPSAKIRAGAHLVAGRGSPSDGHLTSCVWSPILNKHVALALLRAGTSRLNQAIKVYDDGKFTDARVVSTCFFDPDGEKLKL
ncbi:2Fe-2S iron-sulfur cluster-binding protein [Paraburkholderia sp. RL18-103-BIB-C]|uniref:2Fe-2S iron-sulfur cluster-binding protein n=1 Tax=Paraburkholderia sp. RL18-103-BIB-C TaxID=3031637 RepID=UPI0038BC49D1